MVYTALHRNCSQWAPISELISAFLSSSVCNLYTTELPFLDSAHTHTHILKIVSSAITVNTPTSLLFKMLCTNVLTQVLSSECFIISSLGFLFYLSVLLNICPKFYIFQLPTWHFTLHQVIYNNFYLTLGAILVKGATFFSSHTCQEIQEQHWNAPSCLGLSLLLRISRRLFLCLMILSVLQGLTSMSINFCDSSL